MTESDFRIFISSPGDVEPERIRAGRVIDRLNTEHEGRVKFTAIRWEEAFYTADKGFQDQIPKPSQTDLVVCILWKRLGSELPSEYNRPDGTSRTGTEYEFEVALETALVQEVPDILVYRKAEKILFNSETVEREQADLRALEAFWQKWFHDEQGHFTAGFHKFNTPDQFEAEFEKHLRQWLEVKSGEVIWPIDLKGSPYRGLEAFKEEHAPVFFGRRRAIEQVRARITASAIRGCAFLLVLGTSGSGKSSLLRAGVMPRLLKPGAVANVDRWRRLVVRPSELGEDAIFGLAEALFSPDVLPELRSGDARTPQELADDFHEHQENAIRAVGRALERWALVIKDEEGFEREVGTGLILVVDQFEEIFQLPQEEQTRVTAVLYNLANSGHTWVLVAMRSDFYPTFQASPELLALKEAGGTYDLVQPGQAEFREIIHGPTKAAGLGFERQIETGEDLAYVLEQAAIAHPGSLPLLEFTLEELFKSRDRSNNQFLFNQYRVLGGLEGAIERRAEDVYNQQSLKVQAELPWLLRSLASISAEGSITAKTLKLKEGVISSARKNLIELFVEARLLVSGGDEAHMEIRVAHEALLTHWERARNQLETDRQALQVRARINTATVRWREENRSADILLPEGKLLAEATELLENFEEDLDESEIAFVKASTAKAGNRRRLKRLAVTGLLILTVLTGVIAVWAVRQQKIAEEQRIFANKQKDIAEEQRILANKQKEIAEQERKRVSETLADSDFFQGTAYIETGDIHLGLAHLSRALRNVEQHQAAASRIITSFLQYLWVLPHSQPLKHEYGVQSAAFSQDGKRIVTLSDKTARIWDTYTGKPLSQPLKHEDWIQSAVFSQDGKQIATTSRHGTVRSWDTHSGQILSQATLHIGQIHSAVFSPDGKRIVTVADKTARIWDADTGQPLYKTMQHKRKVRSAVFSPDGKRIVTASGDKTARIWDAHTGQPLSKPMQHKRKVRSAIFSPDGKRIVTASHDGTARIWDAHTGQPLSKPMDHKDMVRSAIFSPDGKRIVTVADKTARIWDAHTGQPLSKPMKHKRTVRSAVFSPDGKRIVTASHDGTARIWDTHTGQPLFKPIQHHGRVHSAVFSPDGKRIVTASWDRTARIWDVHNGQPLSLLFALGHVGPVNSAFFSPDGKRIVTASWDYARIWDADTGQPLYKTMRHKRKVRSAVFSPDGKRIVTSSDDGTARIWDAHTGQLLFKPMGHGGIAHSAVFSPDRKQIVTASGKTARIWDIHTGQPLSRPMQHEGWVRSAVFSPDGERIVTVSDKTARTWVAHTGLPLGQPMQHEKWVHSAIFSPDGKRIVTASGKTARTWDAHTGQSLSRPMQHEGRVNSGVFSPDGKRMVTVSDKSARIWDAHTGQPLSKPMQHKGWVSSAFFSPDGKRMVTASGETARIWDTHTGQPLSQPMQHKGRVSSAFFSPDGKRMVTTSDDGTARIWDAHPGQPLSQPMQHENPVFSAVFSPDGKRIATLSFGRPRIWDAHTGQHLSQTLQHKGWASSAVFSPDGKRIVTASWDGTARIWDVYTGQDLSKLLEHEGEVTSVVFSPDGKRIVTASWDTTARIWDAHTGLPLGQPMQHENGVQSAIFSPDGKRILTASGKTARIWDAHTGLPLGQPMQHENGVQSAIFSPDGKRILTISSTKESESAGWRGHWVMTIASTARIWDAHTGQPLGQPMQHENQVRSAIFSPDGKRIVTVSSDNTIRIWDAYTGQSLSQATLHIGQIYSAVFSPDGKRVVTVSEDNTARIWDTYTRKPLSQLMQLGIRVFLGQHGIQPGPAVFSPDGKRMVTTSEEDTARIWNLPPPAEFRIPAWLGPLAEAVIGWRLNDQSVLEPVDHEALFQFRDQFRKAKETDPYTLIARWFFMDRSTRPTSPYALYSVDMPK